MSLNEAVAGVKVLPESLQRRIGAGQALNDASSLVKELIDNAYDASATSINIEITANSVDLIQVRDNGYGIAPEDRALVAAPHCTSKLRNFDDLRLIGGTSLGFRGEALASAADLSGSMAVLTKVAGEETAVRLEIARNGQVTK